MARALEVSSDSSSIGRRQGLFEANDSTRKYCGRKDRECKPFPLTPPAGRKEKLSKSYDSKWRFESVGELGFCGEEQLTVMRGGFPPVCDLMWTFI